MPHFLVTYRPPMTKWTERATVEADSADEAAESLLDKKCEVVAVRRMTDDYLCNISRAATVVIVVVALQAIALLWLTYTVVSAVNSASG